MKRVARYPVYDMCGHSLHPYCLIRAVAVRMGLVWAPEYPQKVIDDS